MEDVPELGFEIRGRLSVADATLCAAELASIGLRRWTPITIIGHRTTVDLQHGRLGGSFR